MTTCKVENHYSAMLVTFEDGTDLLLQGDSEQHGFAQDCGLMPLDSQIEDMANYDLTDIEECPEVYYDLGE